MKRLLLGMVLAGIFAVPPAAGQEADVQRFIAMVNEGRSEEVRKDIPTLLTKYPNDPGVLYVQALVTKEGTEAVRVYQSIVDNFPKSQYADAALYRVYQFYYALGLYRTAELKLNQLKHDYPKSKYLTTAGQEEMKNLPEEREAAGAKQEEIHAPVAGESPTTPSPSIAKPTPADSGQTIAPQGRFALQVGAFGAQVNAEKQKLFFEDLGYPVEVISKMRDTRTFFVVLVGTYGSAEEAKAKGAEIKKKYNIESMVVPK